MQEQGRVHVYANGRRFVVVPVVDGDGGAPIELEGGHTVPLTLGRPTVVRLSRALGAARADSEQAAAQAAAQIGLPRPQWDGEDGRWWDHHLLGLAVCWAADQITITELQDEPPEPVLFPKETPDSVLAEQLIARLGEKLHAA